MRGEHREFAVIVWGVVLWAFTQPGWSCNLCVFVCLHLGICYVLWCISQCITAYPLSCTNLRVCALSLSLPLCLSVSLSFCFSFSLSVSIRLLLSSRCLSLYVPLCLRLCVCLFVLCLLGQERCGPQFTSKLEGMINDLNKATQHQKDFSVSCALFLCRQNLCLSCDYSCLLPQDRVWTHH